MPDTPSKTAAPKRRYKTFLMFGAPGCGKGTQGKIIGQIPRFYHFSSGDAFRSVNMRTKLGKKFFDYTSRGELVPDELTIELCQRQIKARVASSDFKPEVDFLLLDGIPRTVDQAKMLDPIVNVLGVFHLSCPNREELARRIRKRAIKENRLDDANEEIIRSRFRTYEEETKPILDHYAEQRMDIDASQPPVKVLSDILDHVMKTDAWQELSKEVI